MKHPATLCSVVGYRNLLLKICSEDTERVLAEFTRRAINWEMMGENPSDWRAYVEIYAPFLRDSGELICLGDHYVVSLGAHATHTYLLMDRIAPKPLTIETSLNSCALLSYVTDSPIVPRHSERLPKYEAKNIGQFHRTLKGTILRSVEKYFDVLVEAVENVEVFVETGGKPPGSAIRTVPPFKLKDNEWTYVDWPKSDSTWRAITAYWSGLLSVAAPARILNFWRAMEAVKRTKEQRYNLFESLEKTAPIPVWTEITRLNEKRFEHQRVNAALSLKTRAVKHKQVLVKAYGSAEKVLDMLYWERRGKAAHADKHSLEYDGLSSLGDQLRDATLLQYLARIAIQEEWQ